MAIRQWMQQVWVPVLILPLTSCVVLGSSRDVSERSVQTVVPQLP